MPHPELMGFVTGGLLCGLLVWAAVADVLWRKIPNAAVLGVLGLYVAWALAGGGGVLSGLSAAVISFILGYGLYLTGVMGAGDIKLFTVVALFAGLDLLASFALATVLAGGAVALVSMVLRPRRALVMLNLKGRGDFGRGVPYGVAIAAGGILVVAGALFGLSSPLA